MSEYFPRADDVALEEISRRARFRRIARGDSLIGEEEDAAIVGGVLSGVLRLLKTLPDGRVQIVGLRFGGDMFGRLFAPVSHVAVEAAMDTTVWTMERTVAEAMADRHPCIAHEFLQGALGELDRAREWMVLLGSATVTQRLARFLVILGERQDRVADDVVRFPVGRRDVAGYLGTTVESISRFGREVADRGIARFVDARTVNVTDWTALRVLAGLGLDEPIHIRPRVRGRSAAAPKTVILPGLERARSLSRMDKPIRLTRVKGMSLPGAPRPARPRPSA